MCVTETTIKVRALALTPLIIHVNRASYARLVRLARRDLGIVDLNGIAAWADSCWDSTSRESCVEACLARHELGIVAPDWVATGADSNGNPIEWPARG